MRVLGIDEAGRGCVLGPLVVGAFLADLEREPDLWDAGAADSKALSADKRVEVRGRLVALGTHQVREIQPEVIDGESLNVLEEQVIAELVREYRPDRVIVDALGAPKSLPKAIERLKAASGVTKAQWIVEPKADANHATVAAASIFAKTWRDARIEELMARWGALGSGYPSDPVTKTWLRGWAETGKPWPAFVRTKWRTIEVLAQQSLF